MKFSTVASDEELSDVMTDAEKFNAKLDEALGKAVAVAIQAIAPVSNRVVTEQLQRNNAVLRFWWKNDDIAQYHQFVGSVTEEVEAAHPDWNLMQLLEEAGKESRARLTKMGYIGVNAGTPSAAPSVAPSPAPARPAPALPVRVTAGGAPVAPILSDFEKDFNIMDAAANQFDS